VAHRFHRLEGRAAGQVTLTVFVTMLFTCTWTSAGLLARDGQGRPGTPQGTLIEVPYLSQTPELCGGAALAMVLRYWGTADVFAQDFALLVEPDRRGIRTEVLARAARDRGWETMVAQPDGRMSLDEVREHVSRGRPVIALIEERANVLHYVVVLGVTPDRVVVHDPARAPYRALTHADFERRWAATSHWMMLVLPAQPPRTSLPKEVAATAMPTPAAAASWDPPGIRPESAPARPPDGGTPCSALVERSVQRAREGDRSGAEAGLRGATELCPESAAPWRELAGLRFVQSDWTEARKYGERAVRLDPADAHAWELLGAASFLQNDPIGALAAWNRRGQPRVDTIKVTGAARTDHPVVVRLTGLEPRQLLTPEAFARAERRLDQLPAASDTSLRYTPNGGGTVGVEALVRERRVWPSGVIGWGTIGGRALLKREIVLDVAGPTGSGEIWHGSWRWAKNRPRLGFGLDVPAASGPFGIIRIEAMWERQAYAASIAPGSGGDLFRAERRRGGIAVDDWITSRIRWSAGAAFDQFDRNRFVATQGGVELRLAADRVALLADGGVWAPVGGARQFQRLSLLAALRTSPEARSSWHAEAGGTIASRHTPLALWPGGNTNADRDLVLRAHPLHDDGVVRGDVLGRQTARASIEHHRSIYQGQFGRTSVVGFIDAGRAWRRANPSAGRDWHVDAGVGVRITPPGSTGGLRLDVGYGLRDGAIAVSAGWMGRWPRR